MNPGALRAPLRLRWRLVLGGAAGATSGISGDAKIRGAAWGVAPRRMRRFMAPPKLAPAELGHSALHLTDQGERFVRAWLPRVAARRPGCAPAGVWIRFPAPCAGPSGRSNRSAARRRLKLALQERDFAGS